MKEETLVLFDRIPESVADDLIQLGYKIGFKPSRIYQFETSETLVNNKSRSSEQAWVNKHEHPELFYTILDHFEFVNRVNFNYDISHGVNEVQILKYESKSNDFFEWHQDVIYEYPSTSRKISMTMQLSDPSTYEGGDLLIGNDVKSFECLSPNMKKAKKKSSIIFFNSYLRHCVTPVTKGVRYSLVAWASGPPFR